MMSLVAQARKYGLRADRRQIVRRDEEVGAYRARRTTDAARPDATGRPAVDVRQPPAADDAREPTRESRRTSRQEGPTITNPEFSAVAGTWHDFYLTAGAASATLIGLLFVGLSINLDEFTSERGADLRLLAEQAFANFIFVLLIALFVLVPNQDASSLTVELAIIGIVGALRMVRRVRAFRRRQENPFGGWVYVVRRLGLPGAASIGLVGVGLLMLTDTISAFFWLLGIVLVYLMSAADTTWDLLIEVGRERRRMR